MDCEHKALRYPNPIPKHPRRCKSCQDHVFTRPAWMESFSEDELEDIQAMSLLAGTLLEPLAGTASVKEAREIHIGIKAMHQLEGREHELTDLWMRFRAVVNG